MNINVPLPPHLDQFVRDQLASGCFQSEADLVHAALRLLEGRALPREPSPALDDRQSSSDAAGITSTLRSPRGILADIRSYISPDDIREARNEMWAGFRDSEA